MGGVVRCRRVLRRVGVGVVEEASGRHREGRLLLLHLTLVLVLVVPRVARSPRKGLARRRRRQVERHGRRRGDRRRVDRGGPGRRAGGVGLAPRRLGLRARLIVPPQKVAACRKRDESALDEAVRSKYGASERERDGPATERVRAVLALEGLFPTVLRAVVPSHVLRDARPCEARSACGPFDDDDAREPLARWEESAPPCAKTSCRSQGRGRPAQTHCLERRAASCLLEAGRWTAMRAASCAATVGGRV